MWLNRKGEVAIGTGIKVLVSVVVGSLLLCGTYAVTNETVLPNVNEKIVEMFDVTPESRGDVTREEQTETVYDNALVVSKYGRRLFMINKNYIEQKYGISVAEDDVQWLLNGAESGTGYYYSYGNGEPIEEEITVQAVIHVQKGTISEYPDSDTIFTTYSD